MGQGFPGADLAGGEARKGPGYISNPAENMEYCLIRVDEIDSLLD
jgi:hypothetical protein